ncbi:MAG: Rrf2 family transcriptional regulator [Victivallales bacterium]
MRLSTKTRYGARLMIQLALDYGEGYSLLKDIAEKENLSEKYLSLIVLPLKAEGLIVSGRGAKGGYMLAKRPSLISMKEIVEVLEDEMPGDDVKEKSARQQASSDAVTGEVWRILDEKIKETLETFTLEDLVDKYNKQRNSSLNYDI